MTQLHPAADAYLQSVRRLLDAPVEDRERFMARLSHAVSTYVEENPEAVAADIAAVFGTPESCAAELLAECDPAEISRVRRKKRRLLLAAIVVLAALLAAMAALVIYVDAHQVKYVDIYITTQDVPNAGGSSS